MPQSRRPQQCRRSGMCCWPTPTPRTRGKWPCRTASPSSRCAIDDDTGSIPSGRESRVPHAGIPCHQCCFEPHASTIIFSARVSIALFHQARQRGRSVPQVQLEADAKPHLDPYALQHYLALQVERRTEVALRDAKLQKISKELASVLAAHDEVMLLQSNRHTCLAMCCERKESYSCCGCRCQCLVGSPFLRYKR